MIKDEELAELSDDPEWAFVEYERTVRQRANAAINEAHEKEIDADEYRIDYISHVLAAAKALRLDFLSSWKVPSVSQGGIAERYLQFQSDVNFVTLQIRFEHARRVKRYSVALDPRTKALVRHHLQQIKEVVDRLDVSERKKSRLYAKIAALENELSRDRTSFDVVAALVLEARPLPNASWSSLEWQKKGKSRERPNCRRPRNASKLSRPESRCPRRPATIWTTKFRFSR